MLFSPRTNEYGIIVIYKDSPQFPDLNRYVAQVQYINRKTHIVRKEKDVISARNITYLNNTLREQGYMCAKDYYPIHDKHVHSIWI